MKKLFIKSFKLLDSFYQILIPDEESGKKLVQEYMRMLGGHK